jgi:bla regulator protein BlaR1
VPPCDNLMIGFLILFGVAIGFTFFTQLYFTGAKEVTPITITIRAQLMQAANGNVAAAEKPESILTNCVNYFNTHSDTIVLIWLLIICARFVQLAAGLHSIYHIKRTKVLAAGIYWDNKISNLSNQLGIKRTVQILQSGIAKLPMVLGHFKPVILIPIGLLTLYQPRRLNPSWCMNWRISAAEITWLTCCKFNGDRIFL